MISRHFYLPVLIIAFIFSSCSSEKKQEENIAIDEHLLRKQLENVQKPVIRMENDIINSYIKQHQLKLNSTGTGLRYIILKENKKGKKIQTMDVVRLNFKIYLLDGTLCYSSEKDGNKLVKVDYDNVETGLHEGLKLMHTGEKALFILPSHLAHGVVGDNNKIPPKSPLKMEIEVLD
jgi:FKBP-type peptidyl-prolyl cis-trans isomerase